ncbi:hypothetical protein QE152_g8712 [Popillia japonica]|uniref:NodB homology domain-containing protein n=1 Tax=Popillia japonica TaxID=7064 RepID=A0AAW1M5E5_POPJA
MIKFCVLLAAILVLVSSTPKSGISRADDLVLAEACDASASGISRADDLVLAEACDASACSLPDCRCMSTDIPGGLDISEIPQIVLLTFDDAITALNYAYYEDAFFTRTNPDGCPVQATYFMSHEYTDYSKVHDLHARGHEIALHSITHEPYTAYWDELDVEGYIAEFGGERDIVSHFADIPEDDIQGIRIPLLQLAGIRIPLLQLAGNKSFQALQTIGMKYDCSWPTQSYMDPPLWPYTLDYKSEQDCPIGECPTASFPGIWVQPMVNWRDTSGYVCSMVDACIFVPTETDEILEFIKTNFHRHYDSNKAPFGFYMHAAWFQSNPNNYEAYLQFLDYLESLNDVYIVSIQRALEWVQNPKSLDEISSVWSSCPATTEASCTSTSCALDKDGEARYMVQCRNSCPSVYPWLNNPLGV